MRRLSILAFALGLLLGLQSPAGATIIGLSEKSSEPGVPPGQLLANFDFQVSGSTLTLTVTNFSAFDITELYFNTTSDITGLTLNKPPTEVDWTLAAGPIMVNGFGNFGWGVTVTGNVNTSPATIDNGTSQSLEFSIQCKAGATCDMFDFGINNNKKNAIAAKFIAGPGEASAFGASGEGFPPVPEPATAALVGMGLVGLAWAGRGRNG